MFEGVSDVLGMFRLFWGVLDQLLHFLNLNIRVCCKQLGVHLFLGVFCTFGPP